MQIDLRRLSLSFLLSVLLVSISSLSYIVYRYYIYIKELEKILITYNEFDSDKVSITLAASRTFNDLFLIIVIIFCGVCLALLLYYTLGKNQNKSKKT